MVCPHRPQPPITQQHHCDCILDLNQSHNDHTETGKLFMWGDNWCSQLGLGDKKDRQTPEQVTVLADKHVVSVALGGDHTLALVM